MNVPYLLLIKVALGKLQCLWQSCSVSSAWYQGWGEGALTLCRGRVGVMVRCQYTTSEVLVRWFNGFGNGELVRLRLTFTPTLWCIWPSIAITFHVHIGEQQYESLLGETFCKYASTFPYLNDYFSLLPSLRVGETSLAVLNSYKHYCFATCDVVHTNYFFSSLTQPSG